MTWSRKEREAWAEHMSRANNPEASGIDWPLAGLPEKNPRARRLNNEARDMERLVVMAAREWWWPGFRHHMQERHSRKEAWDGFSRGVKPGWPDVTEMIPEITWRITLDGIPATAGRAACLAALELKAEERRPRIEVPDAWWLDVDRWEHHKSVWGVTRAQARCLQDLHACGFQTMVAYGAQEAYDWLNEVAGPKPDVLPEGW